MKIVNALGHTIDIWRIFNLLSLIHLSESHPSNLFLSLNNVVQYCKRTCKNQCKNHLNVFLFSVCVFSFHTQLPISTMHIDVAKTPHSRGIRYLQPPFILTQIKSLVRLNCHFVPMSPPPSVMVTWSFVCDYVNMCV